jgi:signal transduction histidine kinase
MKPIDNPPWRQGVRLDNGVASIFTALAMVELAMSSSFTGVVDPPLVLFVLMQTAFLGFRRRFPLSVHLIATVGLALQANGYPLGISTSATLITVYSAAAYASRPGAGLAVVTTLVNVTWVVPQVAGWDVWELTDTYIVWMGLAGLGLFSRLQQAQSDRRTRRLTQLEQERKLARQLGAADERDRMARELHDSVGHSVTGIILLAGAVRNVQEPEAVRDAIGRIERSGIEAMAELDALLGLLRDQDEQNEFTQPGLGNVDQLFAKASAVGLDVSNQIAQCQPLSPTIDRAAFRIIQESLTNAAKYANPALVSVAVRPTGESVEIEIVNPIKVHSEAAILSGGRGLIGMDERTSILGGTFAAGPTGHGEFRVVATLPIELDTTA